jgi:integrase
MPRGFPFAPADWWRALIVFQYMTGWRIGEPLALSRDHLDLEAGTAVTRADDNKGGRDDLVPLHSVVIEHLRKIASFEPVVFP